MAKRLYVVRVTIESEFAVFAESALEAETDYKTIRQALEDDSDATFYPAGRARPARALDGEYRRPDNYWDDDCLVYGVDEDMTWEEAIERDRAALTENAAREAEAKRVAEFKARQVPLPGTCPVCGGPDDVPPFGPCHHAGKSTRSA